MRLARGALWWVIPPLAVAAVCGAAAAVWGGVVWRVLAVGGLVASLFMAYFHRDPERHPPPDPDVLPAVRVGKGLCRHPYLLLDESARFLQLLLHLGRRERC